MYSIIQLHVPAVYYCEIVGKMGNSQSQNYHLNGHGSTSNGGSSSRKNDSVDSGRGSPISKEEMESRFSQLVVRVYRYDVLQFHWLHSIYHLYVHNI